MADYVRGERLRELRDAKHESQENVAYAVGVSAKALREWEHGGKIRWENAKKLGAFYGVDPETLVSREAPDEDVPVPTPDPFATNGHATDLSARVDEIAERVNELHDLLLGAGSEDAELVAGLAARLLQAAELPHKPADAPPQTPPAARRRKRA